MKILFNKKKVLGAMYNATTYETTVRISPKRISCRTISVLPRTNHRNKETPPDLVMDTPVEEIRAWIAKHPDDTFLPILIDDKTITLI
jgi:hypothetical protein